MVLKHRPPPTKKAKTGNKPVAKTGAQNSKGKGKAKAPVDNKAKKQGGGGKKPFVRHAKK